MGVPGSAAALLFGQSQEEAAAYEVSNSLRLDSADTAYLKKRFSRTGNRRTFTFSCWVKIGTIANDQRVLFSASNGNNRYFSCDLRDNRARILQWNGSAVTSQLHTEKRLVDPAAWYHLVFSVDTTASTSDRYKIYVNGERQSSFVTEAQPSLNEELYVNVADNTEDYPAFHQIGNNAAYAYNAYFEGLIAECRFIDGEALNASDLGAPDSTSGIWNPKDYTHGSEATSGGFTLADNDFTWSGLRSSSANDPDDGSLTDGSLNYGDTFYGNDGADGAYLDINMAGASAGEVYSVRYWNAAEAGGQTITATCKQIDSSGNGISGTSFAQTWNQGQKWNTYVQTIASNCHRIRLIFSGNSNNSYGWGIGEVQVNFVPKHINDFYLKFDPSVSGVTYTDGNNNTVDSNDVVNSFIVDAVGNDTFAYHSAEYGTDKIFGKGPQGIYTSYPSNSVSEYKIDLNALGSFGTISQIRLLIRFANGSQYSPWNVSILDANKSVIGGPHVVASGALSWQNFSYSGTPRYIKLDDGDGASSKRCILGGIEINGVVLIDHTSIGADSSGRSNDWYEENLVASAPTIQYGADTSDSSFDSSATSLTYNTTGFTYSTVSSPKTDSGSANASTVLKTSDGTEATFVFSTNSTDRYIWTSSDGINWTSKGSYYDTDGSPQTITAAWVAWAGGSNASTLTITFASLTDTDILIDTPNDIQSQSGLNRGTYAALSLVDNAGLPITEAGFACGTSSGWQSFKSTIGVSSGKFYWESRNKQSAAAILGVAMLEASVFPSGSIFGSSGHGGGDSNPAWTWAGQYDYFNGTSTYTGHTNHSASDIVMYALDLDNGKLWFGRNGTWYGSSWSANGNPATGANPTVETLPPGTYFPAGTVHNGGAYYNFGQHGSFSYTPPTGFKTICTTNLPDSPITDGSTAMDAKTYVGNGGSQSITGLNFGTAPSLVWIKNRSHYTNEGHALFDVIRGKQILSPAETQPESNWHDSNGIPYRGYVDSFDTNGFSLVPNADSSLTDYVNYNNATYVAWVWSAGNGNRTYTVTVVNSGGNKYRFDGSPNNAVTLDLAEGSTYTFDQSHSSNTGHPIRFGTSANGTGYTTGVTHTGTPGSAGAKTTLVLASGAPTLYYSCQHHSGMGGQINTNSTGGSTSLIGSLNSSVYDQSSTWSSNWSASGNGFGSQPPSHAFDGNLNNYINNAAGGQVVTWDTTSYSLAGKLRINCRGAAYDIYVNGSKASDTPSSRDWVDCGTFADINEIQFAGSSYNSGNGLGSAGIYVYQIEVAGKILIDSSVTPPNSPAINATVKANPDFGFSVINYITPSGNDAADSIIAHGLNKAPEMVFLKPVHENQGWTVYHKDIPDPLNSYLYLETTSATVAPGIETFIVDQNQFGCRSTRLVAGNSQEIAVFAWTSIPGFSAFGKYVGGGSTSQPFAYTGFSPRWLLIKNISNSSNRHWLIIDTARSLINQEDEEPVLFADEGKRESFADNNYGQFGSKDAVDFLSNGFRVVEQDTNNVYTQINRPGDTHVWAAFAENPFKLSRGQ